MRKDTYNNLCNLLDWFKEQEDLADQLGHLPEPCRQLLEQDACRSLLSQFGMKITDDVSKRLKEQIDLTLVRINSPERARHFKEPSTQVFDLLYDVMGILIKFGATTADRIAILHDHRFEGFHMKVVNSLKDFDPVLESAMTTSNPVLFDLLDVYISEHIFLDYEIEKWGPVATYSEQTALAFIDRFPEEKDIISYLIWYLDDEKLSMLHFHKLNEFVQEETIPKITSRKFLSELYILGNFPPHIRSLIKSRLEELGDGEGDEE